MENPGTLIWIVVIILLVIDLLIALSVWIFSGIVIHSRRQPIVRTPQELGMAFEEIAFPSTDGLEIRGWYIPPVSGDSSRVVLVTHPMPMNRHGFLAKNQGFPYLFGTNVDLLKTVHHLHQAGYGVLNFDLRNHGESQSGITGNGLSEYQDVLGALAYIQGRSDLGVEQMGFVSFCMGASSSLIALSRGKPEVLRQVKFLVAIQPVSAIVFFRSYMRKVFSPLSLPLLPLVARAAEMRGGFRLEKMSPARYLSNVTTPTLYVQARQDPWTELDDIQTFYESTPGAEELWWIEEKMGRFDAYNYVGEHPQKILEFAKKHFEG